MQKKNLLPFVIPQCNASKDYKVFHTLTNAAQILKLATYCRRLWGDRFNSCCTQCVRVEESICNCRAARVCVRGLKREEKLIKLSGIAGVFLHCCMSRLHLCTRACAYDMTSCELILVTVIPLAAVSREKSSAALQELHPDMRG